MLNKLPECFVFVLLALGVSSLECPLGSEQIGPLNSDIGGCGLEGCNNRYQDSYATIQDCLAGCKSRTDCKSFTWAPLNGDKNHNGKTVCSLYNSDVPNKLLSPQQIMCKPVIGKRVAFKCMIRRGVSRSGIDSKSTVSCLSDETLVSCGIDGWEHIGGAWIDNNNQCIALSHDTSNAVTAVANCCLFPSKAIIDVTSVESSSSGTIETATCNNHHILTGCNVYYASGAYNQLIGSYAGSQSSPPQTKAWINTDNTCTSGSRSGTTIFASAQCLQLNSSYSLECKTKAQYTTKSGFVGCDTGYQMMSCNTWNTQPLPYSLDDYHLDSNGRCYVQQDGWKNMYANAICCQLTMIPIYDTTATKQAVDDCHTAKIYADCDNRLYVYLKQKDGTLKLIGSESDWHKHLDIALTDVTRDTVIQFKCVDVGSIGAFIATVEYKGVLYSTKNPITDSNFDIVEGDTTTLIYHTKTSSPWHISTELIEDDAYWVWNDQTYNTMKFDFDFANIISSSNSSSDFECGCNEECIIYCDEIDAGNGCSNTVIDGRTASSLTVYCDSSKNRYYGGCQFSTIYCPQSADSQCNIQCNDYYGCYLTKIYGDTYGDNTVNVKCMNVEGSCLKTQLFANRSSNVNVSCYGGGILGSKDHSSCHNFNIHVEELTNDFNLLCWDDFSCFNIYLYGKYANYINIHARGNMALSTSYIYADNAGQLDLFCGSEESEYGCYKLYTYNPIYSSIGSPRTSIKCQGHGCYDAMYFYSKHGALDIDISLDGCYECNEIAACILNWYFYCNDYKTFDTFHGDSCDGDLCDCDYGMNEVKTNWVNTVNNDDESNKCDIFTFNYECPPGAPCIINCNDVWPDDNGCYDKSINGGNATSLTVICNSTSSNNPIYGTCESSHIYCPYHDDAVCNVECNNKDSCYDTEITVINEKNSKLNLKCMDKDSCSHTNVYGAYNDDISIHCIATDSCDNINVTANYADNITIHCQGNANNLQSYSSCDGFNIYAENVTNEIKLVCLGDYSCYSIDIYALHAHKVVIESMGDYGSYGGNIFASNADIMSISCKSEYHQYGCYKMNFYLPESATILECQGHGCYFLELYAKNGYKDLIDIKINGCNECNNNNEINQCVDTWYMHCGEHYSLQNVYYGQENIHCDNANCGCYNNINYTFIDDNKQCDLLIPDHSCDDGKPCIIDCGGDNSCENNIIFGNNATSLTVNCGDNGCMKAQIFCPTGYHSECNIKCTESKTCDMMDINAEKDSILDLECSEQYACDTISVYISNTFKSNINCTKYESCPHIALYGDDANDITLSCIGNYSYYNISSVCDQIVVHAKHAKIFRLNCFGNNACYPSSIDVDTAYTVFINAKGSYSIFNGWISAQNVINKISLNLQSINGDKYGVEDVSFYLPINDKTYLNCIGYGCHNINFYTVNGMKDINNISFYGCSHCIKPESCITDWNLYCGDSYVISTTFTGSMCEENNCDCDELRGQIEESFSFGIESIEDNGQCDKNDTIIPNFVCVADKDCYVDCKHEEDCKNKLIYGGKAKSLTIKCGHKEICNNLEIYCPETFVSECNLICNGYDACFSLILYGDHHNKINIEASDRYSFEYSTVYAYDAIEVNLNCSNLETCYSSNIYVSKAMDVTIVCFNNDLSSDINYLYENSSPCYGLNIFASSVENNINLKCIGDYSCYLMNLYAQNANNVIVSGINGKYGMADLYIYASNANNFELICIGSQNDFGCTESYIYLPSKQNATINCYGFGCNDLYLFDEDGMNSLSLSNILLNSCGICLDETECITVWYIYCNGFKQYDHFAAFDGKSCLSSSNGEECGCSENKDLLKSVFINKPTMSQCKEMGLKTSSTTSTTIEPTDNVILTVDTTMNNTNKQQQHHRYKTVIIFIITASVVFIICIIGNIIYCYKKKVNEKIAHEILQSIEAPEGGVDEIALEPMDANIGKQITVKTSENEKKKGKYVKLKDEAGDGNQTGGITGVSALY